MRMSSRHVVVVVVMVAAIAVALLADSPAGSALTPGPRSATTPLLGAAGGGDPDALSSLVLAHGDDAEEDDEKEGSEKDEEPTPKLDLVIKRLRNWVFGFATVLALLFLTIAGLFYVFAAGNPAQIERAKLIVRGTVIGYSLMVLAPVVVEALERIVK